MDIPKLDIRTVQTFDGRFNVGYSHLGGPYDKQVIIFAANGLEMPSPAKVRYMQSFKDKTDGVMGYSRTDMDVVNMPEAGQIALVDGGVISMLYGGVNSIVDAHRKGDECVIVGKKDNQGRDRLYGILRGLENHGRALIIEPGKKVLPTDKFSENPAARFLHGNEIYGINPNEIGRWLQEQGLKDVTLYLDDVDYMKSEGGGIYINKLRVAGPADSFCAFGNYGRLLGSSYVGAFGVRFTPAKGGSPKNYTIQERDEAAAVIRTVMSGDKGVKQLEKPLSLVERL